MKAMRHDRTGRIIPIALCACGLALAGCVQLGIDKLERLRWQEDIYPEATAPDAPLVVILPGLRITILNVAQQQYSGHLIEMLAREGIPARHILYDTKEHPLSRKAAVFSEDLAIAWTRVGPGIVRELELENERRGKLGLPPVTKLVLFAYSQGSPIMEQIARKLFYEFPKQVEKVLAKYGDEWDAIRNDPQFASFIEALEDFLVIKNIKVQREEEFMRVPDLRAYYARAEKRMFDRFDGFLQYLIDPSTAYPDATDFEEPDSLKYPKRYYKAREWADGLSSRTPEDVQKMREFFVNYAEYRPLLDVTPYFFSVGGTYLGSPQANVGVSLLERFPAFKIFTLHEYKQIQQTQYGTSYHMASIEELAALQKKDPHPIDPKRTLFVVGTVGGKGDGFIEEESAHMSDHSFTLIRVEEPAGADGDVRLTTIEETRLPDLPVLPVKALHFPIKWRILGRIFRYGVAYMTPDNPVFPYFMSFIRGDWDAISDRLAKSNIHLSQFMLQVAFPGEEKFGDKVTHAGHSQNVSVGKRIVNPESDTAVWAGRFKGREQEMKLIGETARGTVHLELQLDGGRKVPLDCTVYPGCASFVKLTRE